MNTMKVSIIIPAYNTALYLERSLTSLQQSLQDNYEVWLIDDGSEDDTFQRLQQFADGWPNVHALTQKHSGPAAARNVGLMHANGEYVYFMDSDDYIEPDGISTMVRAMKQDDADVVVSGIYEETSGTVTEIQYRACRFQSRQEYLQQAVALWDTHLPYTIGNKIYRASFLKENGIFFPEEYVFGEDTRFNMQVFALAHRISVLDKSYYHYVRERPDSTTTRYKDGLFEIRNGEYELFWDYFNQQDLLTDEGVEYLSRRHAERLAGCVVNLFLPGNALSLRARLREIKRICRADYTAIALSHAKLHSQKMKLILWPVKQRFAGLTFMIGAMIAFVQVHFPGLFIRLKAAR